MKYIRTIILALVEVFAVTACDVLNVEPTLSIPSQGAIKTPNDLEKALMGCYDGLQSASYYGRNYLVLPDLAADNLDFKGTSQDYGVINNNVPSPDLFLIEDMWASIYRTINRVNNVIYYLPYVENLSETAANNYLGELKFLRALCYFDLVRIFGGVPLRDLPTLEVGEGLNVPRSAIVDVYQFIFDDLDDASGLITNSTNGRATSAAAKALLARAYLYSGDYDNAWAFANDVLTSNSFTLELYYENIFLTPFSSESIFEIDFNDQDDNRLAQYFATSPNGRYEFGPYPELVNLYQDNDERLPASIDTKNEETPAVKKYSDTQSGSDNVVVIRLAEMYLIRAEAELLKDAPVFGDVIADINAVRLRAGLTGTTASSFDAFMDEILLQRRLEFAFDGHRWFDLIRFGKAIEVLETVTSTNQFLFPIPQSEILSNSAISPSDQNPGY